MPPLRLQFAWQGPGRKAWAVALLAGAVLAFAGAAQASPFQAQGGVYTSAGTSGTAATSNSSSGMRIYRNNVAGQEAIYQFGAPGTTITAAGGGLPATFVYDVGSQWSVTVQSAGQTTVAVAETRLGQFGWTGPSYVYFDKHILTPTDITNGSFNFNGNQQAIPAPSAFSVSSS